MGKKFERELRGRMISLEELEEWKKKRDAVILAHYYVRPEVQAQGFCKELIHLEENLAKEIRSYL